MPYPPTQPTGLAHKTIDPPNTKIIPNAKKNAIPRLPKLERSRKSHRITHGSTAPRCLLNRKSLMGVVRRRQILDRTIRMLDLILLMSRRVLMVRRGRVTRRPMSVSLIGPRTAMILMWCIIMRLRMRWWRRTLTLRLNAVIIRCRRSPRRCSMRLLIIVARPFLIVTCCVVMLRRCLI